MGPSADRHVLRQIRLAHPHPARLVAGGVETYTVAPAIDPDAMDRAKAELTGGGPTGYVALRVDEGEYTSSNRGLSLRMLIEEQCLLCRPPTAAEREALEAGFKALGIRDLFPGSPDMPTWH